MRKAALLIITSSFPIEGDGSESAGVFVADLAEALAMHVPVRIVAPGRTESAETTTSGISIWRFSSTDKPLSLLSPKKVSHWPAIWRTLKSLSRQTSQAASDGQIAHVFALWVLPSGWAARRLWQRLKVPYTVWALGSDIWSLGRLPFIRRILGKVSRNAHLCFADGLALAKDASAVTGVPYSFLASTRRLDGHRKREMAASGPYHLVYLGRWHANKGIDLLLTALAQLTPRAWSMIREVTIAGGGPLHDLVRVEVARLQSMKRPVQLLGYLDRTEATALLERADFLLIPSRVESIPLIFSDAMKMLLPVVAMPVGDLPTLIADYGVGTLATSIAADAFAKAIEIQVEQPPKSLEAALIACASDFSIDARRLCEAMGFDNRTSEPSNGN